MNHDAEAQQVLRTLVGRFGSQLVPPTVEELEATAKGLADLLGFTVDVGAIVLQAREQISHRMGEGVSLIGPDAAHDPNWLSHRAIEWKYSDSYLEFLRQDGWPPRVADSLGMVTRRLVGYLQDPEVEGSWDRRGLVIGHVQSGKTANYLGLVARAADAGYKFIVVVAGIHNNLRRQTQERVDEGFVGEVSDPTRKEKLKAQTGTSKIGVGLVDPDHKRPVALTSTADDFKKAVANSLRGGLEDWSKPVIVVIKKNRSTLVALNKWLEDFNRMPGQKQIANIPMLFIDDEADNASINTNKPELKPTTTNRLIRNLLGLFRKSCYVGYTATPFANIFINPEAYDEESRKDLFPEHFIHCLDAPSNYFGAERLFLEEESKARHISAIEDCETIIPLKHAKTHEFAELPPSLKKSIRSFLLARVIRTARGQGAKHCSMLINISRFVDVQSEVDRQVTVYLEELRNAILASAGMPADIALKNAHLAAIRSTFETEKYDDAGVDWKSVQELLPDAIRSIITAVVNSKSPDGLNYADFSDRGEALNVIAIGGLSLSRGLTIEGLTISYMYRNTKMYDTLLQMGRWFGYRPGYEDLCRVWLAADSIGWYTHISEASEELRDRIKEMNRSNATPRTFGLMVESHPDSLTVTAMNKMRAAETRTVSVSYDGKLVETYVLSSKTEPHEANIELFRNLHDRLLVEYAGQKIEGGERPASRVWRGIPADIVNDFLADFQVHPLSAERVMSARKYLSLIKDRFPVWDIVFVSLKNADGESPSTSLGDFQMVHQTRSAGTSEDQLKEIDGGLFVTNNQRVAGTGDESAGLSRIEMEAALQVAASRKRSKWTDRDTRHVSVRGAPLLMLHLIDLGNPLEKSAEKSLLSGAPAIGLSFPATGDFSTVEYVLNRVMVNQLESERFDSADDEDDYDRDDVMNDPEDLT
ncbi:Z1 domain-containing protein [Hyphomonas oceanitis]|uniref:Endonuclease n=1 Tax=Hyphomonas oceanitis SCH89 TaxID=1280953 RepID=A0A059GA68_9PROT|nr:Z1 domain-containing protein [Hyphomonas oceanitis]KDA03450.1 endonuclease [Hyphomonas oceanitis SCH89]